MSAPEIQRWDMAFEPVMGAFMEKANEGHYVTYADHVATLTAAVAEAEQRRDADWEGKGWTPGWYRAGVSDERERIRKAVEALRYEEFAGDLEGVVWIDREEVLAVIANEEKP